VLTGHCDERAMRGKPRFAARNRHVAQLGFGQIVEDMRLSLKAKDFDVKRLISQSAFHHGSNPSLNKFKPLSALFC
jgi:hypothetical protein